VRVGWIASLCAGSRWGFHLRSRIEPGAFDNRLTASSHSMAMMCTPATPSISRSCWISSTQIWMPFCLPRAGARLLLLGVISLGLLPAHGAPAAFMRSISSSGTRMPGTLFFM
jgi:hypothetical protein